jgi:hypothetical protein
MKYGAISKDPSGEPVEVWVGTVESVEGFRRREERSGFMVEVFEVEVEVTRHDLALRVWPPDPNAVRSNLGGLILRLDL